MFPRKRRPVLFAVLAAAMLLTSGTAGVALAATPAAPTTNDVQDEETPDGEEIIESFRDRIDSLETVQFTRTEETTVNNETSTRVVSVAADLADTQKRVETLNATTGSNTTTVWNDTSVVTYYPDENRVTEFEVTGTSLLPSIEGLANESLISYEYRGVETVDGQETYVLDAVRGEQAPGNDDANASATLYVDTETYFPVQTEWETSSDDIEHRSTVSYENVTLDAEIPDSTFELDLPDDVEDDRDNTLPDVSEHDSYDSVVSSTDLAVPDANLTDGFSFQSGVVVDYDDFHSVTLTYTDGNESVSVVTRAEPITSFNHSESDRYEAVDVGDTTGYLFASGDFLSLYVEGDQPYTVHGEVDEGTAIDVAEALLDE